MKSFTATEFGMNGGPGPGSGSTTWNGFPKLRIVKLSGKKHVLKRTFAQVDLGQKFNPSQIENRIKVPKWSQDLRRGIIGGDV